MKKENKIVIYEGRDGKVELHADIEKDTIWATQKQIATLFDVNVRTVNEHIINIFKNDELREISVIRNFRITGSDGKKYLTNSYNLDLILAVGYRVNSKKATQFRIWATSILREYLVKGFNLNQRTLTLSKEKLDDLHEAIEFIQSAGDGKPVKAKLSLRLTKDIIK